MKNKILIGILILLNLVILVGYNNCGQLSHGERTSTQATNPGDFGGDDGPGDATGEHDIYFSSLISNLCNKILIIDPNITFPECYSQIFGNIAITRTFYNHPDLNIVDDIIMKLNFNSLLRSSLKSDACALYIQSFVTGTPSFTELKEYLNNYIQIHQIINPKSVDFGVAILINNVNCTTFIREP